MDLTVSYLGIRLKHPLMVGASPMVDDLGTVRRLEDAGAAAIVMHSLFEEQLVREQAATVQALETGEGFFAEAQSFLPTYGDFRLGPDEYLEQLRRIKQTVEIPVIASLNGSSLGGWLTYAGLMEEAGADALELNVYFLPTDPRESSEMIERRVYDMVQAVKRTVKIPVAVKLSPFYTSLACFARRLDEAGADGLVLFNRFYQPDLDPEELQAQRVLRLSDSTELPLRLRWLAILFGHVGCSLAATGGVHNPIDAVKAVMAGASAVQVVSALLRRGPEYLRLLLADFTAWVRDHDYATLDAMRGALSLKRCPDPAAFERANYMQILQSWQGWDGNPG